MELEDVVHVLRKVHKALRPRGVLLDIHPVPAHAWVEVVRDSRRKRLGYLDSSTVIERVREARRRRAAVLREGLFVPGPRRYFDWHAHYPSIEDWFRRREEYGSTAAIVIPPEVLRRVRVEMRRPGTIFVVGERTRATLLTRCP